jgi:hypothetical protein
MKSLIATLLLMAAALSAQANVVYFHADLSGANEAPPNASLGTGFTDMTYDSDTHLLAIHIVFGNLTGLTTASHIHCCTAVPGVGTTGVATELPSFDFLLPGLQSGDVFGVEDLSNTADYNPAFLTAHGGTAAGAEAFLLAGMMSGQAYLNIHTNFRPGGEIRGFLQVPEPVAPALALMALAALGMTRRACTRCVSSRSVA